MRDGKAEQQTVHIPMPPKLERSSSGASFCSSSSTHLSKSVFRKWTFLASFSRRGQYSSLSSFLRRLISTFLPVWWTLLSSALISA